MKKSFIQLGVFLLMIAVAGTAWAVPFQVSNSTVDINVESGYSYFASYTHNPMDQPIELAEGESATFKLGTLDFAWANAEGTADITVYFATPTFDNTVEDQAEFDVWSWFFISGGSLTFGAPVDHAYTYNGLSGGVMTLGFIDTDICLQCGHSFDIMAVITNKTAPIPEPATMLLMGAGLIGLVGVGRRKFSK